MKVLILGANGQLGRELARAAWPESVVLALHGRDRTDLAVEGAVAAALGAEKPDVIVNAGAYTAVDKAESEPEKAYAVNGAGSGWMAQACAAVEVPLIHVSTDYVFDGYSRKPYKEYDLVRPLGVYGASKLAGEQAIRAAWPRHVILRTGWVYGVFGHNFVKTMLGLGRKHGTVRVVADQWGTPTAAKDIAGAIVEAVRKLNAEDELYGTYHLTNRGFTSWHGFADAIFAGLKAREGIGVELIPITTAEYPTLVRRPSFSRLDGGLLRSKLGISLRPWMEALDDVLDELIGPRPNG